MKQGGTSTTCPEDTPRIHGRGDTMAMAPSVVVDLPDGLSINFHSPEFNRTDDLDDNLGNYRDFHPLDGIVTADMRHQMERRKHQPSGTEDAVDAPDSRVMAEQKPSDQKEDEQPAIAEAPLTLISHGRVLIAATDEKRAVACAKQLYKQGLQCTLVVASPSSLSSPGLSLRSNQSMPVYVDKISVAGAFGEFSATAAKDGKERLLADWLDNGAAAFDLVLDLQSAPSYDGDRLPAGYYWPGERIEEALSELPQMRGRFQKPVFTVLQKDRCLHGRSKKRTCDACLEICPVHAIQRMNNDTFINPYLCQGCGGCSLVCPADAILQLEPSTGDLLREMQTGLGTHRAKHGGPAKVVISDMKQDAAAIADPSWLHVDVDEIAHAGLELLLAAFVFGAENVVVACNPDNPSKIIQAVASQVDMAKSVLEGLDMPADKIRFSLMPLPADTDAKRKHHVDVPAKEPGDLLSPALEFAPGDRRMLIRELIRHLHERSGSKKPWFPLPEGSPFGAVFVDAGSCTSCMACAAVCPVGALEAGNDVPTLFFHELRCHQCGLCEGVCPENAIKRLPRMSCDPDVVHGKRPLLEGETFHCVACGVPFATRAMVSRMQEKLHHHWMYDKETQLRRLGMCRTCRARDALMSKDMNAWNQR